MLNIERPRAHQSSITFFFIHPVQPLVFLAKFSLAQQCCMMLTSFEQAFILQQRDANTKESKHTVLESDDFPLRRSLLLFDNNL